MGLRSPSASRIWRILARRSRLSLVWCVGVPAGCGQHSPVSMHFLTLCFASDFLNHSILKIPSRGSACLTDLEAVDVVESWREGAGQGAAAVVAEREVRDLRAGPDGAGHPAGGRGPGRGGPVDGGAYLPYGQAGGVGRAGRVGAGPAGWGHTGR